MRGQACPAASACPREVARRAPEPGLQALETPRKARSCCGACLGVPLRSAWPGLKTSVVPQGQQRRREDGYKSPPRGKRPSVAVALSPPGRRHHAAAAEYNLLPLPPSSLPRPMETPGVMSALGQSGKGRREERARLGGAQPPGSEGWEDKGRGGVTKEAAFGRGGGLAGRGTPRTGLQMAGEECSPSSPGFRLDSAHKPMRWFQINILHCVPLTSFLPSGLILPFRRSLEAVLWGEGMVWGCPRAECFFAVRGRAL